MPRTFRRERRPTCRRLGDLAPENVQLAPGEHPFPRPYARRFWTMLAHAQGGLFNAARLARGMDVSSPTISRYLDLLVDLMLVRRMPPFHVNVGKRLVKSPKVYVRDSGVVHALLGIADQIRRLEGRGGC